MKYLSIAVLAALLIGCGGGSGSESDAAKQGDVPAPEKQEYKYIVLEGLQECNYRDLNRDIAYDDDGLAWVLQGCKVGSPFYAQGTHEVVEDDLHLCPDLYQQVQILTNERKEYILTYCEV